MKKSSKLVFVSVLFFAIQNLPQKVLAAEYPKGQGKPPFVELSDDAVADVVEPSAPIEMTRFWQSKFEKAPFVFRGKVSKITYGFTKNADESIWPVTYVSFQNIVGVKGQFLSSDAVLGYFFGPVAKGSTVFNQSEDTPLFSVGDDAIVFLRKNGNVKDPLQDNDVLFMYNDHVYTPYANSLISNKSGGIYIGNTEKIDAILVRDLQVNGAKLIVDPEPLKQDEKGFNKLDFDTFISLISKGLKSDDVFISSKIGAFAESDLVMTQVAPKINFK